MKRLTFILLAFLMLTGCSGLPPKESDQTKLSKMSKISLPAWLKPKLPSFELYKTPIIQGSVLNANDIDLLTLGMSKSSVVSIIGSPSISDPFNQNQWDYINHSSNDKGLVSHYHLKLMFKNGVLSEINTIGINDIFDPS